MGILKSVKGRLFITGSFLAVAFSIYADWPFQPPAPDQAYAPDHILVKFKHEAVKTRWPEFRDVDARSARTSLGLPTDCELVETGLAKWLRSKKQAPANQRPEFLVDLERPLYLRVPAAESVEHLLEVLRKNPAVEYTEPDHMGTGGMILPNDPNFTAQWYHYNTRYTNGTVPSDTRVVQAWDITQGNSNVIVAVLDTGLNTNLAEFTGRTVPGYDFANVDSNPADDHNHGTAVSSILAARGDNSNLIAGVNWCCRIMPVKVLNSANSGYYSWWADGIGWAVTNGCKVINLSAGGSSSDTTLSNAIMNAIAHGVIFVTITHNDGSVIRFPGSMRACITVGATTTNDQRSTFSNYGSAIDLVAPGEHITTVSRTGTILSEWSGTSFSAPQVAGVAAMLAGLRTNLTHDEACALLTTGADDQVGNASDTKGFDNYYGWGRLNAYNSLILAQASAHSTFSAGSTPILTWDSPPNASNRAPYIVQQCTSLTGTWSNASPTNFTYTATQTSWQPTNTAADLIYYRVRINSH